MSDGTRRSSSRPDARGLTGQPAERGRWRLAENNYKPRAFIDETVVGRIAEERRDTAFGKASRGFGGECRPRTNLTQRDRIEVGGAWSLFSNSERVFVTRPSNTGCPEVASARTCPTSCEPARSETPKAGTFRSSDKNAAGTVPTWKPDFNVSVPVVCRRSSAMIRSGTSDSTVEQLIPSHL